MRARLSVALLALAASAGIALAQAPPATTALKSGDGKTVGEAAFRAANGGVMIEVKVSGLKPGWHGMHLHEKADCSAADFTSSGGHINHPTAKKAHGLLNPAGPDYGDLPNLYVAADGAGKAEVFTDLVKFAQLTDTDGSALVIHANKDDHVAQPIGGAGARVACAVIR